MISFKEFSDLVVVLAESSPVPKFMQSAAKQGLKVREGAPDSQKCCTPTGLARARDLSNGKKVSLSTVKRIKSFVSRHRANYKPSYEKDSKWWQGMMVWGVPYSSDAKTAKKNMQKVIDWADRIIERNK